MKKKPYYHIEDLIKACGEDRKNVKPINNVLQDASTHFNLKTKDQLFDFISNNGLERLEFINPKELEKNPDPTNPIIVDAYEFHSRGKLGYIAFIFSPQKKWIIKSFHLSKNSNQTMQIAFERAKLDKLEGKNE